MIFKLYPTDTVEVLNTFGEVNQTRLLVLTADGDERCEWEAEPGTGDLVYRSIVGCWPPPIGTPMPRDEVQMFRVLEGGRVERIDS